MTLVGLLGVAGCVRLGFAPEEDSSGAGDDTRPDARRVDGSSDQGEDRPRHLLDLGGDLLDLGPDQGGVLLDQGGGDSTQRTLSVLKSVSGKLKGTGQAVASGGTTACLGISDIDKGLEVYDISQLASPVPLGTLRTDTGPAKLCSWGSDDVLGVHVTAKKAYLATYYGGLVVVDLAGGGPTFLGGLALGSEAWAVQVAGGHAYVANYKNGVAAVDISTPSKPSLAKQLPLAGITQDLHIVGNTLYTASMSRFHVVDISTPGKPSLTGSLDITTCDSTGSLYEVWAQGSYAFAISNHGKRLLVIDVSNPKAPAVSHCGPAGPQQLRSVEGSGALLYVGTGAQVSTTGGVQIHDISTPTAPRLLDEITTGPTVYELSAVTCGVLAAVGDGTLQVLTVQPCP